MKYTKITLLAVLAIVLLAGQVNAGEKRIGTAGAQELRIPFGSRGVALGGAALTDISGVEAIYWNPAGAADIIGYEGMFTHLNYIADIKYNTAGFLYNTGPFGVIGLNARVLNIGEFEETTETQPDGTGKMLDPTFLTFGLTYAKPFTDRVSIGANANFISENVDRMSAFGIAFDFGVRYKVTDEFLFGIVIKSLGPDIKWDGNNTDHNFQYGWDINSSPRGFRVKLDSNNLPTLIKFGVSYTYDFNEENSFTIYPAFTQNNFSSDEYNFGAEYSYKDMIFLRGGYKTSDQDGYLWGPTFGAGVKYAGLTFDYTYGTLQEDWFDDNHWITVKFGQ